MRLRESAKAHDVAGVVAVDQVYRQSELDDRVQRRGRDQVTTVQDCLGAQGLGFGDCRGERLAMVVAVGNDADLQRAPPRAF
jgi:hypothetical protein